MRGVTCGAALSLLAIQCNTEPAGTTPMPPAAETATTSSSVHAATPGAVPTTAELVATRSLTLPAVDAPGAAASSTLPVVAVTKTELLVGNAHIADVLPGPLGFAAAIKRQETRSALQLMPLDAALRPLHAAGADALRLVVDATTSYRSFLEAFFTAAHAGFTSYAFPVASRAGERSIPASTPTKAEWDAAHTPGAPQPASFVLEATGVTLSIGTTGIGTGCVKGATGVTIPAAGTGVDRREVAACAARVKSMSPGWEHIAAANVTAAPELDMQTVLELVVAIEASFPTVHFGMMSPG